MIKEAGSYSYHMYEYEPAPFSSLGSLLSAPSAVEEKR